MRPPPGVKLDVLPSQSLPMARKLRALYPGALYHVMTQGDHRERIFRSKKDKELVFGSPQRPLSLRKLRETRDYKQMQPSKLLER